MKNKNKVMGFGKVIIRNRPITKVGFDTGVLVALIDNDKEYNLERPAFFIRKGICHAHQLVTNQIIGVLIYERNYSKKEAIQKTLRYLKENNITIVKEKDINKERREGIFKDLKKQRIKLKVIPKPQDSDLDIMASYKSIDIDCISTTNFKHFIELGKYLDIFIDKVETREQKERREVKKMMHDFFWRPKRKKYRKSK